MGFDTTTAVILLAIFVVNMVFAENTKVGDYSRFQYDHEMMEKVVGIEHDHKVMKYLLSRYQQLEDTNLETAKILEAQDKIIRSLQSNLNQQQQDVNKKYEEQNEAIAAYVKKLEDANKIISETHQEDVRQMKDDADELVDDISKLKDTSNDFSNDILKLRDELKTQEDTIKDLKDKTPVGTGSTFTRWGRPDCPGNGTELVYTGYVGGGHYGHTGSAVNYLCITKQPKWNHKTTINNGAYLYGAEYEFGSSYSNTYFGQNLQSQEPPCAVCRSTRASVIMIPGTNVCSEGWTREYAGYLVAEHNSHNAASEYICLDGNATTAEGSSSHNHNGKLMYLVTFQCGALKCPPFIEDSEVTCVVCTR